MKAIVLSCDRYRPFARHTIAKYRELWPDHPFSFRLPYERLAGDEAPGQIWIKTKPAFRPTVLQLIADLPDDEWIYWCIDDKYPINLRLPQIERVLQDVRARQFADVDGICFCRCRSWIKNPAETLTECPEPGYLERTSWNHIWLHQFLRVGVLRYFFSQLPDDLGSAKEMDKAKYRIPKLPKHRLLVTEDNHAVFGESTRRGRITANCAESLSLHGLEIPGSFLPSVPPVSMGRLAADSSS